MCGDNTPITERTVQELKVGLLEEALGGALGIRAVSDDHVELVLASLEELEAVTDVGLDVRVLEADAHAGQVLLGDADDGLGGPLDWLGSGREVDGDTSSMSQRMASSTDSCLTTSRSTPPSPPPMTRTFLGLGWAFMAR